MCKLSLPFVIVLTSVSIVAAADHAARDASADLVHVGIIGALAAAPSNYWGTPAFDPTTNRYFVARYPDNRVDVVNAMSGDLLTSIEIPVPGPFFNTRTVALDVGRRRLYVLQVAFDSSVPHLNIVDADTHAVLESVAISMPQVGGFFQVTINSSNGQVFVLGSYGSSVFDPTRSAGDPTRVRSIGFFSPESTFIQPLIDATQHLMWVSGYNWTAVVDVDPVSAGFGAIIAYFPEVVGPYALDPSRRRIVAQRFPQLDTSVPAALLELDANRTSAGFGTVLRTLELSVLPSLDEPYDRRPFPVAMAVSPARDTLYVQLFGWNDAGWWGRDLGFGPLVSVDLESFVLTDFISMPLAIDNVTGDFHLFSHSVVDRIHVQGLRHFDVYADARPTETTIADDGVAEPVTTSVGSARLTFADVTAGGVASITPIDPASANLHAPGQFSIAGATAFDISTTATTTGPTTVCFDMSSVTDPDGFAAIRILHGEEGAWVDRTTSSNFATGQICATVTSLSPFVAARLSTSYQTATLFDTSRAFKAGSTIPVKVRLLDSVGGNASSPLVAVNVKSLQMTSSNTSALIQDSGRANPDNNFRYDTTLGGYIFNLSTKGLGPGTYKLTFTAGGDAGYHAVVFQLR